MSNIIRNGKIFETNGTPKVTSINGTSGAITFQNGIEQISSGVFGLGGALTKITTIGIGTFDLVFSTATGQWITTGDINLNAAGTVYAKTYRFDNLENLVISDYGNNGGSYNNLIFDKTGPTFNDSLFNISINRTGGGPNSFKNAFGNILFGDHILINTQITDSIISVTDLTADSLANSVIIGSTILSNGSNSFIFSLGSGNTFTDSSNLYAFGDLLTFTTGVTYSYGFGKNIALKDKSVGFGLSYTTDANSLNIGDNQISHKFSYDGSITSISAGEQASTVSIATGGTNAKTINIATADNITNLIRIGGTGNKLGFFDAGVSPAGKQTSGANLTNNITAGGTANTIDNWTNLSVYATDAVAIRNAIYQLSRKVKQINDGLRAYNLFT